MGEQSLGNFLGKSGRAVYACPRCGRTAPYDIERMIGRGGITCPQCRLETENPPLLKRVTEGEA